MLGGNTYVGNMQGDIMWGLCKVTERVCKIIYKGNMM